MENAFLNSYCNYFKPEKIIGSNKFMYGKQALLALKNIFSKEKYSLYDLAPSNDRNMMKYFLWKIWILKGRRNLQKKHLEMFCSYETKYRNELIASLEKSVLIWDLFYKSFVKNDFKGNSVLGTSYLPDIDRIIEAEDKLNEVYRKFF